MATKTKTKTKTKKAKMMEETTEPTNKPTTNKPTTNKPTTNKPATNKPAPNYRILRPKVDIITSEETVIVYADMPGVSKDSLDVTLDNQLLTLHGKSEKKGVLYQRGFKLSSMIDLGSVSAEISHGILTLTLPKVAKAEPRKIAITTTV